MQSLAKFDLIAGAKEWTSNVATLRRFSKALAFSNMGRSSGCGHDVSFGGIW